MPRISIGASHDNARLRLDAEISAASAIEINVGDGHDMSQRQINIIERDAAATSQEIGQLRELARRLVTVLPDDAHAAAASREALKIAATAGRIHDHRKWYAVSAKGLIEAAEAVGSAAAPVLKTALKVIGLLSAARLTA